MDSNAKVVIDVDDLRRNGSGYIDQTAYKAIRNIEGVREMERGEIYEVQYNGDYKEAVVIAVHPNLCTVLMLDDKQYNNSVQVVSTSIRYANPEMLSYKTKRDFGRFVKIMKDDEFKVLMNQVMRKLQVCDFCDTYDETENEKLKAELMECTKERDYFEAQMKIAKRDTGKSEDMMALWLEIKGVEAERDLYKQCYEKLLDKLVER